MSGAERQLRQDRIALHFLAYDLLALASLAYEQGMAVQVESDYLPLAIVQGKCAV
ncbi:immunity 49 family protein [Gloeobacter morelensis]|uniref:immunity 49 family protein n=1 Tax=Gloeobacter morelensis TaxID=2907343 RepID=UPI00211B4962|nr:immunity 49 family protein [Gloeobacter morelensis]